jgi:preprotein translocase subunit SecY
MMTRGMSGALLFIIELMVLFFVVMGVIMLTQATRRIPIQYAKQVIGNKLYGGKRDFIPMKLNSSGVMPIIFAQALMFIPALVAGIWRERARSRPRLAGRRFRDSHSRQHWRWRDSRRHWRRR